MFQVELRPEIKKQLKDPEKFAKGLATVYTGLVLAMSGVGIMLFLFFTKPENVLHPTWLMLLGLGVAAWGEWMKYRAK
ncbi:MAG: hypothetical protein NPINA01_22220 [Nitrospinaceae bacterium]|nr:MAG: hypothetical protein NPINA01_22220 [Nitrospinaceae bacterium]